MKTLSSIFLLFCAMLLGADPSGASTIMYADRVTSIARGDTSIGNFSGYYGWSVPLGATVELTESQAKAAVLGAPDSALLALPGMGNTDPWEWAYIEVGFPGAFTTNDELVISEYGYSGQPEKAVVWLWGTDGSVAQTTIQRSDGSGNFDIVIDLSPWEASFAGIARVGIGGLDAFGAAQGFDLDAIGINVQAVPIPAALWLFVTGLVPVLGMARRGRRTA